MPTFEDQEFGTVTVRKSRSTNTIRASLAPNGTLRISMPALAPLFMAKRMLNASRSQIRELQQVSGQRLFADGMQIGKSHSILVSPANTLRVVTRGQVIHVELPEGEAIDTAGTQQAIRQAVLKALRKEAKSYLPRRLAHLAQEFGFSYSEVRFSHASSRWGSCSSNGTISLNIALMMQDFSIIDYVLIHELAHTKHMNHSDAFWQEVARANPDYKRHRKILKLATPHV